MRYGYTSKIANSPLPLFDGIIKHDFNSGEQQIHQFEPGCYGGEAVFVPDPQGKIEEQGWLVTFVYDENTNISSLVILNAQDIMGQPVAKVILPQRVPYGFHGIWLSQENLEQ